MSGSDGGKSEPNKAPVRDSLGYVENLMFRIISTRSHDGGGAIDRNISSPTFVAVKPALDPEMISAARAVHNSNLIRDELNATANESLSSATYVPKAVKNSSGSQNDDPHANPNKDFSSYSSRDAIANTPSLKNNQGKNHTLDTLTQRNTVPINFKPAASTDLSSAEKDPLIPIAHTNPDNFALPTSDNRVNIPFASLDPRPAGIRSKMNAQTTGIDNNHINRSTKVTVHIGRIEIRALGSDKLHNIAGFRAGALDTNAASRTQDTFSLKEYLKKRADGRY